MTDRSIASPPSFHHHSNDKQSREQMLSRNTRIADSQSVNSSVAEGLTKSSGPSSPHSAQVCLLSVQSSHIHGGESGPATSSCTQHTHYNLPNGSKDIAIHSMVRTSFSPKQLKW